MASQVNCVELGFAEKIEAWKLKSKYFPSKVGGLPSWLALDNLPRETELQCKKCSKPMIFLCQIYAPISSLENCFHRTLFVFICRNEMCCCENEAPNIAIFRSQLPRKNKYYSFDPPKEDDGSSESPGAKDWVKLCRICGVLGLKVCGGCKLTSYCSRDHQAVDWKAGHRAECEKKELASNFKLKDQILFPEYEIDLEPEDFQEIESETDQEVREKYEQILKRGQNVEFEEDERSEKDLMKMAAQETDKQFARFRTRINQYPDQIVRYERGGEPLYVSSLNKPENIPNCEFCGEKRIFEFQVMPQLLVYLKVDNPGRSIDWGTILVYTCSNSCSQDGNVYVPEMAFKQDYSPSTEFLKQ